MFRQSPNIDDKKEEIGGAENEIGGEGRPKSMLPKQEGA